MGGAERLARGCARSEAQHPGALPRALERRGRASCAVPPAWRGPALRRDSAGVLLCSRLFCLPVPVVPRPAPLAWRQPRSLPEGPWGGAVGADGPALSGSLVRTQAHGTFWGRRESFVNHIRCVTLLRPPEEAQSPAQAHGQQIRPCPSAFPAAVRSVLPSFPGQVPLWLLFTCWQDSRLGRAGTGLGEQVGAVAAARVPLGVTALPTGTRYGAGSDHTASRAGRDLTLPLGVSCGFKQALVPTVGWRWALPGCPAAGLHALLVLKTTE